MLLHHASAKVILIKINSRGLHRDSSEQRLDGLMSSFVTPRKPIREAASDRRPPQRRGRRQPRTRSFRVAQRHGRNRQAPVRRQARRGATASRQGPSPRTMPWSAAHVLNDFGDDHILGLAKHRQCVGNGAPGLGRVVPGDQNIAQIEPVAGFGWFREQPAAVCIRRSPGSA